MHVPCVCARSAPVRRAGCGVSYLILTFLVRDRVPSNTRRYVYSYEYTFVVPISLGGSLGEMAPLNQQKLRLQTVAMLC